MPESHTTPAAPVNAELAARRTSAAAVDTDFRKATDAYLRGTGPEPNWSDWAFRLSAEVVSLTTAVTPAGPALTPAQRSTVLDALADAAGCHERHLSRPDTVARYRSLGDDR